MDNFRGVIEVIDNQQARLIVHDQKSFEETVATLIEDDNYRRIMKERALKAVENGRGALERTLLKLENVAQG